MDKRLLVIALPLVWCGVVSFTCFNENKSVTFAKNQALQSQAQLQKTSTKSINLINETGQGVLYLKPQGQLASKDDDASQIKNLMIKTFSYKSPIDFKKQAEYVKPRVTGEFYDYWFKTGIEMNYKYMVKEAQGRKYQRFMKNLILVKMSKNEYFASVDTGLLIGNTQEADIDPVTFTFSITKQKNNAFKFTRIQGVAKVVNNDPNANSDSDDFYH